MLGHETAENFRVVFDRIRDVQVLVDNIDEDAPVHHNTTSVTSSSYIMTSSGYYVGVNFAGTVTVTLPSLPSDGRVVFVKDESATGSTAKIISVLGWEELI
jgi:hypothetical protein